MEPVPNRVKVEAVVAQPKLVAEEAAVLRVTEEQLVVAEGVADRATIQVVVDREARAGAARFGSTRFSRNTHGSQ